MSNLGFFVALAGLVRPEPGGLVSVLTLLPAPGRGPSRPVMSPPDGPPWRRVSPKGYLFGVDGEHGWMRMGAADSLKQII